MCEKRTYRTKKHAKMVIKRLMSKGLDAQKVYKCPDCELWHLCNIAKRKVKTKANTRVRAHAKWKKHQELDLINTSKETI